MNFKKNVIWIGLGTFMTLISQFIVAKIAAIYLSKGDFGLIGQYISFIAIVQAVGGGIFSSSITKYLADYNHQSSTVNSFYSTAFFLILLLSMFMLVVLSFFSHIISKQVLFSEKYFFVIILLAISVIPYNFSRLILSSLTGFSKTELYSISTCIMSLILLIVILSFFYCDHSLKSIFIAFPLGYLILSPYLIILHRKLIKSKNICFKLGLFSKQHAQEIFSFALMPIEVLILGPISQILIRIHIIKHGGLNDVGEWQAIVKISDAYLIFFVMLFSNYFIPLISKLKNINLEKKTIKIFALKLIFFAMMTTIICIMLRKWIIVLLYTNHYLELERYLVSQFCGDFFRIIGFIGVYTLIAKAQIRLFVIVELVATCIQIIFSIYGYKVGGIDGIVSYYCIGSFIFMLLSIFVLQTYYKNLYLKAKNEKM